MCVPEAPVKRDLIVKKDVVKASFGAVLRHYSNIWHLNTSTDELTQVGVIELPEDRNRESKQYMCYTTGSYFERMRSVFVCLYLTCLTSCLMVLEREKDFVWILLMATALPSLKKKVSLNTQFKHSQEHLIIVCQSLNQLVTSSVKISI